MQTSLNVYTKPKSQTEREKMNSTGLLLQKKILSSPSSSACSSIESVYCNITTILLSSSQLEGWRGMMLCYNIWEIMGLNCIFGNIRVINYLLYLHTLTISSAQLSFSGMMRLKWRNWVTGEWALLLCDDACSLACLCWDFVLFSFTHNITKRKTNPYIQYTPNIDNKLTALHRVSAYHNHNTLPSSTLQYNWYCYKFTNDHHYNINLPFIFHSAFSVFVSWISYLLVNYCNLQFYPIRCINAYI